MDDEWDVWVAWDQGIVWLDEPLLCRPVSRRRRCAILGGGAIRRGGRCDGGAYGP